jgi:predicted nucleic-acid-binding Zn-ribbon protein
MRRSEVLPGLDTPSGSEKLPAELALQVGLHGWSQIENEKNQTYLSASCSACAYTFMTAALIERMCIIVAADTIA